MSETRATMVVSTFSFAILVSGGATATATIAAPAAPFLREQLHGSLKNCLENASTISPIGAKQITGAYVKCVASDLGLWSDESGYNAMRVAQLFANYEMNEEVKLLVDYCNDKHRQLDGDGWAYDAYKCATAGRLGTWITEYRQNKPWSHQNDSPVRFSAQNEVF